MTGHGGHGGRGGSGGNGGYGGLICMVMVLVEMEVVPHTTVGWVDLAAKGVR